MSIDDGQDMTWNLDSDAAAYMTSWSHEGACSSKAPCHGNTKIVIGDGTKLKIQSIDSKSFQVGRKYLDLKFVLIVSSLKFLIFKVNLSIVSTRFDWRV